MNINKQAVLTERPLSLMSDRRVVRGNTYSGAVAAGGHAKVGGWISELLFCIPDVLQPDDGSYIRRSGLRKSTKNHQERRIKFCKPQVPSAFFSSLGPDPLPSKKQVPGGVIPPVPGRRHMDLQTELWLEVIADRKEEKHVVVQATPTDTFSEIPAPSCQVVVTAGPREDKETQIYNNDPHLFVFDKEVSIAM